MVVRIETKVGQIGLRSKSDIHGMDLKVGGPKCTDN